MRRTRSPDDATTAPKALQSPAETAISRRAFAAAALGGGLALAATGADAADASNDRRRFRRIAVQDRFDLLDLLARYHWAYDCGDVEAFLDVFTPDAVVVAFGKEAARGRDAIREWAKYLLAMREKDGDDWQHLANWHRFDGAAPGCTVYSFWTLVRSNRDEQRHGVRSVGYYRNEFVKKRGEWLLAVHRIERWNRNRLPWVPDAP